MANEALIAYENAEKQKNLDQIAVLQNRAIDIDNIIIQLNENIASYQASKADVLQEVTALEGENVLIDEIIVILSA